MFYKVLLTLIFSTYIFAGSIGINDKFSSFTLPDQFDKIHTINPNISKIIVSFEKGTGKEINTYLSSKDSNFLKKHNSVFIADISGMPSIITKMFALPKMRDYKHIILLIYDDKGKKFIQKDEQSTVYSLKDGVITNVEFVSTQDQIDNIFR